MSINEIVRVDRWEGRFKGSSCVVHSRRTPAWGPSCKTRAGSRHGRKAMLAASCEPLHRAGCDIGVAESRDRIAAIQPAVQLLAIAV